MTFSTLASPGVSLQGGGGSGSGTASLPISGNGATVTASTPLINGTQTWNNGAVTFTSLLFNVTDTASAAGSLLMDLQVGGSSKFRVTKSGDIDLNATGASITAYPASGSRLSGSVASNGLSFYAGSNCVAGVYSPTNAFHIGAPNGSYALLTAKAVANLRLGAADAAAPVAQTLSVQSVVAGTSNTAGANLTITGSQGTGTGAGGSIIFQVAPAGSSGSAQNSLVTFFEAAPERAIYLYNTTDVTTNYERSRFQWTGNELRIGTQNAGTGTLRSVGLYQGNTRYQIIGGGFNQFDQAVYMNGANIATDTSTGFKIGTGTTQKIGFWNAAPIAQPTTAVTAATVAATGVGDVVAASTTFDGYTIPQIVKALRNAGLLA